MCLSWSMPISDDQRNTLGMQLTRRLGQLLGDGSVQFAQATEIADFILAQIDRATSHEEIIEFLLTLQSKWPFFETQINFEKGAVTAQQDKQKVAHMAKLIKTNQVDAAIAVAKST